MHKHNREVLGEELRARLVFDSDIGLKGYLDIEQVDPRDVKDILTTLKSNTDLETLKKVCIDAVNASQRSNTGGEDSAPEKRMYRPIYNILRTIADFSSNNTTQKNFDRLIAVDKHGPRALPHDKRLPELEPDVLFLDVPANTPAAKPAHLRELLAFAEIKPATKDPAEWEPISNDYKQFLDEKDSETRHCTVKKMVKQCAEYCAWMFAGRPFQLHIIFLCIYGMNFRVGVCDRGGMVFSPKYAFDDNKGGLEIFVRVIRRIACNMDIYQLGLDPTVKEFKQVDGWPCYEVEVPSEDGVKKVTTDGPPLASVMSLIGRGTSVWKLTKKGAVLKTAWRRLDRRSEYEIYKEIPGSPERCGIARVVAGGDMKYEKRDLSVEVLREGKGWKWTSLPHKHDYNDFIMHRVQVSPVGKPLWEFDNPLEFLQGALDALKGLDYMYTTKGILHRDVSAGNVYLWNVKANDGNSPEGMKGFVADLEFAHVPKWGPEDGDPTETQREDIFHPAGEHSYRSGTIRKATRGEAVTVMTWPLAIQCSDGPEISGTIQFMAYQVLQNAIAVREGRPNRGFAHQYHHDLESFILVLYYAIYKKSTAGKRNSKNPADKRLVAELDAMFGNPDGHGVLDVRSGLGHVPTYLSAYLLKTCPALRGFCRNLSYELRDTYSSLPPDEEDNDRFTERADKVQLTEGGDLAKSYSITFKKLERVLKEWIQALKENQEDNHFKADN